MPRKIERPRLLECLLCDDAGAMLTCDCESARFRETPTAEEWNRRYPVGTAVKYWPIIGPGDPVLSYTRSPAWALGHGEVVVAIRGRSGGVALAHLLPIDDLVEDLVDGTPHYVHAFRCRGYCEYGCSQRGFIEAIELTSRRPPVEAECPL